MIDLSQRALEAELLDAEVSDPVAAIALGDLRLVNRWLGNRGRLLAVVRPFLESRPGARLLDVGCASADILDFLRRSATPSPLAVGLDIKLLHLRDAPRQVRCVVGNVSHLPFPPVAFDVVTVSLFLHHFASEEIPPLLRSLYALAKQALIVNDLERARVPYAFARLALPLLFRSRLSVADGLLSIRRGFTRTELAEAFAQAAIPVRIERSFPYRLLAVATKSD